MQEGVLDKKKVIRFCGSQKSSGLTGPEGSTSWQETFKGHIEATEQNTSQANRIEIEVSNSKVEAGKCSSSGRAKAGCRSCTIKRVAASVGAAEVGKDVSNIATCFV